jgi:hypothetical protein
MSALGSEVVYESSEQDGRDKSSPRHRTTGKWMAKRRMTIWNATSQTVVIMHRAVETAIDHAILRKHGGGLQRGKQKRGYTVY